MTIAKLVLTLVCLMSVTMEPKEAKVTPLLSKDLTDFPGKEGLMITVEYPPGSSDPIHRHNAHAFVYVLEGSIVMQVRGVLRELQRKRNAVVMPNRIQPFNVSSAAIIYNGASPDGAGVPWFEGRTSS